MQKVLISGGSGLIGSSLTQLLLSKGYQVGWLSRGNKKMEGVTLFKWDVQSGYLDPAAIAWPDVLIHLAGEGIADKRWTKQRKAAIISSRTKSAELLIHAMKQQTHHIHTVVAASAIGYYGETHNRIAVESDDAGTGFLAASVKEWENANNKFELTGVRLVKLRIGIVLTAAGGALKEMVQSAAFRILPVLGNGKQIYSWVHVQDVIQIIAWSIEQPVSGVYNAVAPQPVTLKALINSYGKAKGKWYLQIPVPAFLLQAVLGEMSAAVLTSQQVSAAKITGAGYTFSFPEIDFAMQNIVAK